MCCWQRSMLSQGGPRPRRLAHKPSGIWPEATRLPADWRQRLLGLVADPNTVSGGCNMWLPHVLPATVACQIDPNCSKDWLPTGFRMCFFWPKPSAHMAPEAPNYRKTQHVSACAIPIFHLLSWHLSDIFWHLFPGLPNAALHSRKLTSKLSSTVQSYFHASQLSLLTSFDHKKIERLAPLASWPLITAQTDPVPVGETSLKLLCLLKHTHKLSLSCHIQHYIKSIHGVNINRVLDEIDVAACNDTQKPRSTGSHCLVIIGHPLRPRLVSHHPHVCDADGGHIMILPGDSLSQSTWKLLFRLPNIHKHPQITGVSLWR